MEVDLLKNISRKAILNSRFILLNMLCLCLVHAGMLLVSPRSQAQIHPLADQYQMNFFQVNPATAGVITLDPLVINARQSGLKWRGYNPPNSESITFQGKLFKEKSYFNQKGFLNRGQNAFGKIGLGMGFFNYSYGSIRETGVHLDYAYHIFVGDGRLSFGLAPVFIMFRANFPDGSLDFNENPDDVWNSGLDPIKLYFLDFNAGVHYYSENLTAGFSCIQIFNSSLSFKGEYGFPNTEGSILNPDLSRTFYGYSGYAFDVYGNGKLRIEPFMMLKYNDQAINRFRIDLTTSVYLNQNFQSGLTYKLNEGGAVFFGLRWNNFRIKYQFEFPINNTRPVSFTAHVLQVGFDPGFRVN